MLGGRAVSLAGNGCATSYAAKLLEQLGAKVTLGADLDEHPAVRWQSSGLLELSGAINAPGLMCPVPIASCADGAFMALAALAAVSNFERNQGAEFLSERAPLFGFSRQGSIAPGGSCRLLQCSDAYLAINLARHDDWGLLNAWLEADEEVIEQGDWAQLASQLLQRSVSNLVRRGREMGLPVCVAAAPPTKAVNWFHLAAESASRNDGLTRTPPKVIDLSSLWAGPLSAQLLRQCGAEVTKVESQHRPDGARLGNQEFWQRLNSGKREVSLDFSSAQDLQTLKTMIADADIVIEASRPRALRQLGIHAEQMVEEHGLTWISISGYGRQPPESDWVAFGDDAGVAAGLSWLMHAATGQWMFCGDAIADPLTGLHAALAALASFQNGGGRLIAVPMREVVAHCIQHDLPDSLEAIRARQRAWTEIALSA